MSKQERAAARGSTYIHTYGSYDMVCWGIMVVLCGSSIPTGKAESDCDGVSIEVRRGLGWRERVLSSVEKKNVKRKRSGRCCDEKNLIYILIREKRWGFELCVYELSLGVAYGK